MNIGRATVWAPRFNSCQTSSCQLLAGVSDLDVLGTARIWSPDSRVCMGFRVFPNACYVGVWFMVPVLVVFRLHLRVWGAFVHCREGGGRLNCTHFLWSESSLLELPDSVRTASEPGEILLMHLIDIWPILIISWDSITYPLHAWAELHPFSELTIITLNLHTHDTEVRAYWANTSRPISTSQ